MIRQIVKDTFFLSQKSTPATPADKAAVQDLLDTVRAHAGHCAGMAANMIGVHKQIIAFDNNGEYMLMLNPEILRASGEYEAQESCLSLLGGPRPTKRFRKIKVQYQTLDFKLRQKNFEGWTAQIVQHEIDHLKGILI